MPLTRGGWSLASPDAKGQLLWKQELFEKTPNAAGQIVFGGAADEHNAYFALMSGEMQAIRLQDGKKVWSTPWKPEETPDQMVHLGAGAAVTVIPGVVFSGGWDGVLRAFSTTDGKLLWQYNTMQDYKTVNGVPAKGGSMGAPGPTVANGMLFVGSGYIGTASGIPGNVLLAFSPE